MPKGRQKLLFVSTIGTSINHESPTKATHILHKQKNQCIYPSMARPPLFGASLSALLPRLDDCHHNDHHYHKQYDDGIAHPLPRVPLQLLGVLKCTHTLLYVVGSIGNLETEEINMLTVSATLKKPGALSISEELMQKYEILTCVSMLLIMSP